MDAGEMFPEHPVTLDTRSHLSRFPQASWRRRKASWLLCEKKENTLIGVLGFQQMNISYSLTRAAAHTLTYHPWIQSLESCFSPKITRIYNSCSAASDGASMFYACVFGINISYFRQYANELWEWKNESWEKKSGCLGRFSKCKIIPVRLFSPAGWRWRVLLPPFFGTQRNEVAGEIMSLLIGMS